MQTTPKKIFFSGGSGFLGKALMPRLRNLGYEVTAPNSRERDLTRFDDCIAAMRGSDMVVHAAGFVPSRSIQLKYPADVFYKNTVMALQILEAAREVGIRDVILIGSIRAYGNFPSPLKEEFLLEASSPVIKGASGYYGLSKWAGFQAGRAYAEEYKDMRIRCIVFSNLYGPDDKFDDKEPPLAPAFVKMIIKAQDEGRRELDLGKNPGVTLDLLYVDDACDLVVKVLEHFGDEAFDAVNGGSGRTSELREIARLVADAAAFGGTITWSGEEGTPPYLLDVAKARGKYGWEARVSLDEGVRRMVKWYKEHYEKE